MADRTITSDLIVAVDGSDEINVTVDTIRGLIKADKTFTVPAGFNIFHLFVDPELAAVSPYAASDNRRYIADDVTFSPETKATADADGTYFNRVYYTRYDIETEVWSTWTPYNFQIMAIDQFTSSGVPDVYMQAMLNGYMMFTKGGMLYRLVKYDSTNNKAWFITDNNDRVKLVKNTSTGMWAITALGRFNIINFASTNGTLSEDNVAYLDVARTFTLEEDLAVLHHYQMSTTSTTREYNLMGVTYSGSTKYWIDVDTNTGAYTVTTQSISSGGGGIEFYDLTESVFMTAASKADTHTNFITLSSTDVVNIRNGIRFIPSTTTHANTIVPFMATLSITNSSTTNIYPRGCTSIAIYYNGDNMDTYEKLFILDLTNSKLWCYRNIFNYTTTGSASNPTIKPIAYSLLNRRPDRVFIAADDVNYVPWKFEYRTTDASDVSKKHFYYSARKADGTLIYLHIMFNTSSAGSASIERLTSLPTS